MPEVQALSSCADGLVTRKTFRGNPRAADCYGSETAKRKNP
jgi:hypothetical protein